MGGLTMKRYCLYVLLVSVLFSCAKEIDTNIPETDTVDMVNTDWPVFRAETEYGDDAKTSLAADGRVLWEKGDAIAVFNGNNAKAKYVLKSTDAGKASGEFEFAYCEETPTQSFGRTVAVYPYNMVKSLNVSSGGSVEIEVPKVQYYRENSFGKGTFPMIAVTDNTSDTNLSFKNLFGILRLNLLGEGIVVNSIIVYGARTQSRRILDGNSTVTWSGDKVPSIRFNWENPFDNDAVVLDCGNTSLSGGTAKSFDICLPPVRFDSGLIFVIETNIGPVVKFISENKQLSLARSQITEFAPLTINECSIYPSSERTLVVKRKSSESEFMSEEDDGMDVFWHHGYGVYFATYDYDKAVNKRILFDQWSDVTDIYLPLNTKGINAYSTGVQYNTSVERIYLPDGMTDIGNLFIDHATGLKYVHMPENAQGNPFDNTPNLECFGGKNITSDGRCAFNRSSETLYAFAPKGISYYEVPENSEITTIGRNAFRSSELKGIKLKSNITYFQGGAFYDCTNLEALVLEGYSTVPGIGSSYIVNQATKIYVPDEMVSKFKNYNQYWRALADRIFPISSYVEVVDLGLSVNWAAKNLGADKATDMGSYFAWGETAARSSFSSSNYKWSSSNPEKYNPNTSSSRYDGKSVLELSDDAATVALGAGYRIPTKEEWRELWASCSYSYEIVDGVPGCRFTSRKAGFTDRSIFLPMSHRDYDGSTSTSFLSTIWLNELAQYSWGAYNINNARVGIAEYFNGELYVDEHETERYHGLNIRPVKVK